MSVHGLGHVTSGQAVTDYADGVDDLGPSDGQQMMTGHGPERKEMDAATFHQSTGTVDQTVD
jgi:hypothetical protein